MRFLAVAQAGETRQDIVMDTAMEYETPLRLQGKIMERDREIAALTLVIRDLEALNDDLLKRHEWFTKLALLLLNRPVWGWTSVRRDRRIRRMLPNFKLFDSAAYLSRYPDVVAARVDPLTHYILHGMAEGRER